MFRGKQAIIQCIIIILKQGLQSSFYSKPIWSELHKIIRMTRIQILGFFRGIIFFCFLQNLILKNVFLMAYIRNKKDGFWKEKEELGKKLLAIQILFNDKFLVCVERCRGSCDHLIGIWGHRKCKKLSIIINHNRVSGYSLN